MKTGYVISGGTLNYIDSHLAVCAPAFGRVGRQIFNECLAQAVGVKMDLIETRLAIGGGKREPYVEGILASAGLTDLVTNADMEKLLAYLTSLETTRLLILPMAICDFAPSGMSQPYSTTEFGKSKRYPSDKNMEISLKPTPKLIRKLRDTRKDIFLVTFKQEWDLGERDLYKKALVSLKMSRSNIVFANTTGPAKINMLVTPEEYPYKYGTREEAISELVRMTKARLHLSFTRSKEIVGERAKIAQLTADGHAPANFKFVLEWLVQQNAFKGFNFQDGSTTMTRSVGHFGCLVTGKEFIAVTSCRKEDHQQTLKNGMAKIYPSRSDYLLAEGGKPSVGEHTQQAIYKAFEGKVHAVVHFHAEMKAGSLLQEGKIPLASQFEYECGSHQCAENTVRAMKQVSPGIYAVHLKGHGPNIAFSKEVASDTVTSFIAEHWDLSKKEGGNLS